MMSILFYLYLIEYTKGSVDDECDRPNFRRHFKKLGNTECLETKHWFHYNWHLFKITCFTLTIDLDKL